MNTVEGLPVEKGDEDEKHCLVCGVMIVFLNDPERKSYPIGIAKEVLASTCKWHKPIIENIGRQCDYGGDLSRRWEKFEQNDKFPLRVRPERIHTIEIGAGAVGATFDLVHKKDTGAVGPGRILHEWIDLEPCLEWKNKCKCQPSIFAKMDPDVRPKLLIDTEDLCLKITTPENKYIALSYVWGKKPVLQTYVNNLKNLMKAGSLKRQEFASQLPRTVHDAIYLTRLLKERYLWVDALCIVQDADVEEKMDQLAKMASIYSNAQLTVIAAGGEDSSYGLRGIKGVSSNVPRNVIQFIGHLPNGSVISRRQGLIAYNIKWKKRGWTFQENVFSTKRILFSKDRLECQCFCSIYREDTSAPFEGNDSGLERTRALFTNSWPDFETYQKVVSSYLDTQFTQAEDIYNAWISISKKLSRSFPGGFHFGLPDMYFDAALLWQMYNGKLNQDGPPRRRVPKNPKDYLPSWSWMGWHGSIDVNICSREVQLVKQEIIPSGASRLFPLVQWFYMTHEGGTLRKIGNNWDDYREIGLSADKPPPESWKRHEKTQLEEQYFTTIHASHVKFWYPIPLKSQQNEELIPERSHLLWCKAERCKLFADHKKPDHENSSPYKPMLYDAKHALAGYLHTFPFKPEEVVTENKAQNLPEYELVAISKGLNTSAEWKKTLWYFDVKLEDVEEGPTKTHSYYNVLWIEWSDNIAYRKGVGIVFKDVWDMQKKELISLTLG